MMYLYSVVIVGVFLGIVMYVFTLKHDIFGLYNYLQHYPYMNKQSRSYFIDLSCIYLALTRLL